MTNFLSPALEKLQRYTTRAAERYLSKRFGLNWDDTMQDWEITSANADLLPRFLTALSEPLLSDDERYTLMALTIASVDEVLQFGIDEKNIDEYLSSLEYFLLQHPHLYVCMVFYWAQPALLKRDDEEQFLISKNMALYWPKILEKLNANNLR